MTTHLFIPLNISDRNDFHCDNIVWIGGISYGTVGVARVIEQPTCDRENAMRVRRQMRVNHEIVVSKT